MTVIKHSKQVAKKTYRCQACEIWDNSGYSIHDVTPEDWLIVQACEADKWKILPGQEYVKIVYVDDGITTYRARLDMDDLCNRLGFFEDY